jgi:hypothetical protein
VKHLTEEVRESQLKTELDNKGRDGWELVSAIQTGQAPIPGSSISEQVYRLFFRRTAA